MKRLRLLVLLAAAVLLSVSARAETIRSDLPLSVRFAPKAPQELWPAPFEAEGSFGYASPISLGDWRYTDLECTEDEPAAECTSWYRLELASVFHGGFVLTHAREREYLDHADGKFAMILELGAVGAGHEGEKLYALQLDTVGSEYILLTGSDKGFTTTLNALITDCEGAGWWSWLFRGYRERASASVGIRRTNYCVVKSVAGLRRLATRAAAKAVGRFDYAEEVNEHEPAPKSKP